MHFPAVWGHPQCNITQHARVFQELGTIRMRNDGKTHALRILRMAHNCGKTSVLRMPKNVEIDRPPQIGRCGYRSPDTGRIFSGPWKTRGFRLLRGVVAEVSRQRGRQKSAVPRSRTSAAHCTGPRCTVSLGAAALGASGPGTGFWGPGFLLQIWPRLLSLRRLAARQGWVGDALGRHDVGVAARGVVSAFLYHEGGGRRRRSRMMEGARAVGKDGFEASVMC